MSPRHNLAARGPAPVRLAGLVARAEELNTRLDCVAERLPLPAADDAALLALSRHAQASAARVEALCAAAGSGPAGLPIQSRRAYQWLKFLADPPSAHAAAAGLALAYALLARARWPRRPSVRRFPVRLAYYPTAYLYRMRTLRPGQGAPPEVRVSIAPGYLGAPAEVLEAVLRAALGFKTQAARRLLHSYAAGPDFAEATMALELATEPPPGSLRGRHYDLDEIFARVNALYFDARLARPRLAWSRAANRRLLGYYQHASDRLMISQSLDHPRVPACAIELVMYHELLHKHLGVQVVNGRHYAHTAEFRAAERRFRDYAAAIAFLDGVREA